MDLAELIQRAQEQTGGSDEKNLRKWAQLRVEAHTRNLALMQKLVRELDALGEGKLQRILLMSSGVDPDAPTLKVGPHGPGCECVPDSDGDDPECTTRH